MQIPLIAQDKANHFLYGAGICSVADLAALAALAAAAIAWPGVLSLTIALLLATGFGVLVTALVAAWKEWVYDAAHSDVHTVDVRDFLATVSGTGPVSAPLLLLCLLSMVKVGQ